MEFENQITDLLTDYEDQRAHNALEQFVDYLHADRSAAVASFLCHPGSEDLLAALIGMLLSVKPRVTGNAAYALGTISETEAGFQRLLYFANKNKTNTGRLVEQTTSVLDNLVALLVSNDTDCVMNVTGTLGALAETQAGRAWILESSCINLLIGRITPLLLSDHMWIAGNSTLILARLSISEEGCMHLCNQENYKTIVANLIKNLGSSERAMNAAFAIGRLCDQKTEQNVLVKHDGLNKMVSRLYKMLISNDMRWNKNACYAVSCLASKKWGQETLLSSFYGPEVLATLGKLLFSDDHETGWFSAITLRTLASLQKGCLLIRKNSAIEAAMNKAAGINLNSEIKAEVVSALEFLKRLPKPEPPKVNSISASEIKVEWNPVNSKCGFPITYKIFKDKHCVFESDDSVEFIIGSLQANTKYCIQLQTCAEDDFSPLSDIVTVVTNENGPSPPMNLQVISQTVNSFKISWEPPQHSREPIKSYHISAESKDGQETPLLVNTTSEMSFTITGLTAGTLYKIQVFAVNSKSKGCPASILACTSKPGGNVASKPNVVVIGRHELHVTWSAPTEPVGRINHYELLMDGVVIYSGTNMNFHVQRLTPDTEYSFVVSTMTSEGRFDSKTVKKKTAKDEYEANRVTTESFMALEERKVRPQTSVPRRCQTACISLKSWNSSSKSKNNNIEVTRARKSSSVSSHSTKRSAVYSALARHDCSQQKRPAGFSNSCCDENKSHSGKQARKAVVLLPSCINISLRSGNQQDKSIKADTARNIHNSRLLRTKTFVCSQSNRSLISHQTDNSMNHFEADSYCTSDSISIENESDFVKETNLKNKSAESLNELDASIADTDNRMWTVPSIFRNKSARNQRQLNRSDRNLTSQFPDCHFDSSQENQAKSALNSQTWFAVETRPYLELRVPVSTPEIVNTSSSSSRKSSIHSDISSVDKIQTHLKECSKYEEPEQTNKEIPIKVESDNNETFLHSQQTKEQEPIIDNNSQTNSHISITDNETHQIQESPKNEIESPEDIQLYHKICSRFSKIACEENAAISLGCKGSTDSKSEKNQEVIKETRHNNDKRFLSGKSNILPFNENSTKEGKCQKTMESNCKRTKTRMVQSAKIHKFNRSTSAQRRPGTVNISGSVVSRSKRLNDHSGNLVSNADSLRSESPSKSLGIRTMTLTPSHNMESPNKLSEGFLPSQLRTQPCNLNLRQLQRIHTTLLGIRGNNDKLVIKTLLYQRNQRPKQNTTQTNNLGKFSKRQIPKSAIVRGSNLSHRNELISGSSQFPVLHRPLQLN